MPSGIDQYTVLMLHGNGTDEDVTFVDSSFNPHTMSRSGDVEIDTAQSQFGGASIAFGNNGGVGYLQSVDSDDWPKGSGAWTIDTFFRPTNAGISVVSFYSSYDDANNYIVFYMELGKLKFKVVSAGVTIADYEAVTAVILTQNIWYHFEIARDGTNMYFFRDGAVVPMTVNVPILLNVIPNLSNGIKIGFDEVSGYYLKGHIEEYRISNGIARHTAAFTPSISEFGSSSSSCRSSSSSCSSSSSRSSSSSCSSSSSRSSSSSSRSSSSSSRSSSSSCSSSSSSSKGSSSSCCSSSSSSCRSSSSSSSCKSCSSSSSSASISSSSSCSSSASFMNWTERAEANVAACSPAEEGGCGCQ